MEENSQPIQQIKDLPHGDLLEALYFMWDAFERSGIDFFLVKDTARRALKQEELRGNTIDIGVRKLAWISDNRPLFEAYIAEEPIEKLKEDENGSVYQFKNVVIKLHLYDNNEDLLSLNPIHYEHETFNVPNNFKDFDTKDK